MPPKGVVIAITEEDKPYLQRFSPALNGVPSKVYSGKLLTLNELLVPLRKAGVSKIITTRQDILLKVLPPIFGRKKPSIDNYAGSILKVEEFEILIVHPLKQLITKSFGDFLNRRYVSKIVNPGAWREPSPFDWKLITGESEYLEAESYLKASDIVGVDIETVRKDAAIRCIAYSGVRLDGTSMTYVFPVNTMEAVYWMRSLNSLSVPKVFQNGKYDINYLMRYNAPVKAYYYDTANMLHSWYSELPKDLASIAALFIRDSMYWKDMAETQDTMEYYRYNALDAYSTAEAAIAWLQQAPQFALDNYKMKFPQVIPSVMCELTGIKRDAVALEICAERSLAVQQELLTSLQKATGHAGFNPSSPKQCLALIKLLGYKKATDSSEPTLQEAALHGPLLEYFVSKILAYRGERKLSSTYLKTGADSSEFNGRILFALNPHGTDTGRDASRQHHFWCGLQLQNIPADNDVKTTLVADEGFELWEADYAQAEDRGVAYKSGDPALLKIFNSGVDSHSYKGSLFFGIPYNEIVDDNGKVLNKPIRQLAKRINHGANYCMEGYMLAKVMGTAAVREAQRLLKLDPAMSVTQVTTRLISFYEMTFPEVKTFYHTSIKKEIRTTSKLKGDTGWTRHCFSDVTRDKRALKEYVAHVTQSLNAMILDKAFLKIFINLAFNPNFKLIMKIHDSILFQVRTGHEELATKVQELMTFPVPVTDCKGVERSLSVPVDIKKLGRTWRGYD